MLGVLGFRPSDFGFRLLHNMYKGDGIIMIINIGKHLGLGLRVSGLRFFRVLGVLGFRPSDLGFRLLHKMYKSCGIIVVLASI